MPSGGQGNWDLVIRPDRPGVLPLHLMWYYEPQEAGALMKYRVQRVLHVVYVQPLLTASVKLLMQPSHVARYMLHVSASNVLEKE